MRGLIYTRFSSDEKESSLRQIDICKQRASELGIKKVIIFSDDGITTDDRPAFDDMFKTYKPGDAIIVSDADRLSRDRHTIYRLMMKFNIVIASEPLLA